MKSEIRTRESIVGNENPLMNSETNENNIFSTIILMAGIIAIMIVKFF